jgi:Uma2 family endonuclease
MGMPAVKKYWTISDLAALPDDGQRYEVIDGELFVTPSPRLDHQVASGILLRLLADYCDGHAIGTVVTAPSDVTFSDDRQTQPDVYVLRNRDGRRPRVVDWRDLLLVVEILSPATARADRVVKRRLYREAGVPEYWIVDLEARLVERSTASDSKVDTCSDELLWTPSGCDVEPLRIDLVDAFARILDR